MRISSSDIGMKSARNYSSLREDSISKLVMVGTTGLLSGGEQKEEDAAGNLLVGEEAKRKYDGESSFEEKKNALQEKLQEMSSYSKVKKLSYLKSNRDEFSTVKERCMHYLMSIFFGETKKWDYAELASSVRSGERNASTLTETVYYHQETYVEEKEETSFSSQGTVKTADGREFTFGLNVEMSREFTSYLEVDYTQIQQRILCDPLVINLDGDVAELTDQTFFFDIDADGEKDKISTLGKGSGYLALDKNGDGVINDGSELFGTKSGDGFADLSAYDEDGDGWIDEDDTIWEKLLIWTKDENGKDKCYKLTEKDVGAICLSNASTDFALKDAQNMTNGRIRKTGIFLYESGMAGTVQHLDVAKHEKSFNAAG